MMEIIFWKVIVPGALILAGLLGLAWRVILFVSRRNRCIRPWE